MGALICTMDHLLKGPKGIWPCVLGGVAVGTAGAVVLAHLWSPSWCQPKPKVESEEAPKELQARLKEAEAKLEALQQKNGALEKAHH